MFQWVIEQHPEKMAFVLRQPSTKRAAWFSERDLIDYRPSRERDPFILLAWLIQNGLRPYKVEGDMYGFLGEPAKKLSYDPLAPEGR